MIVGSSKFYSNNEPIFFKIPKKFCKNSQECLQKSFKFKLSIYLHVSRRSIRSEPCSGIPTSPVPLKSVFLSFCTYHSLFLLDMDKNMIKVSERSERAFRIEVGYGGDGPDDGVNRRTPSSWMGQSTPNFQGAIRTYGRMLIGKISRIVQKTGNFC